jgi:hypothetical protein
MKIISGTLGLGIKRKHLYEGVKPEKVVDFGSLKKVAIVSAVGGILTDVSGYSLSKKIRKELGLK